MSENEMEILAQAAYYVPEMLRGVVGSFKIRDEGLWNFKESFDNVQAVREAQRALVMDGWKRKEEMEKFSPYSHNVEVGVYYKRFPRKPKALRCEHRWVTILILTRFGIDATFEVHDHKPW